DGVWRPGPGLPLFQAVDAALGAAVAIAEDLGQIDEAVHTLRKATGMLGTRVLHFGVGLPDEDTHNPSVITADAAVYTGTHDNDTTLGWWQSLDDARRSAVADELGVKACKKPVLQGMIDATLRCPATLAILPMQDVLGLGRGGRMNLPGTVGGNWSWRMRAPLTDDDARVWKARLAEFDR
ncbi:MAG: 4-alpha-glucanotransferase, partial [Rhodobacterales bacterium]|nr:4-alpha-glucanotransferase [Rhodobacterales bacterium]